VGSAPRRPHAIGRADAAGGTLAIDSATRLNLELIRTLAGERRGSLLAIIDRTIEFEFIVPPVGSVWSAC